MTSLSGTYLALISVTSGLAGILLYRTMRIVKAIYKNKQLAKEYAIVGEVGPDRLCSSKGEVHNWDKLLMAVTDGIHSTEKETLFCSSCGVFQGQEVGFTDRGLDAIKQKKAAELEAKEKATRYHEFKQRRMDEIFNGLTQMDCLTQKDYFNQGAQALVQVEEEIVAQQIEEQKDEFLRMVKGKLQKQ